MSRIKYKLESLKESNGQTMTLVPTYPYKYRKNAELCEGTMSWNEITETIIFSDNVLLFTRTKSCQQKYNTYLEKTIGLSESALLENIIKNNLCVDNKNSFGIENKFVYRKNAYPYDFGKNQHYLLWIHPSCEKQLIIKLLNKDNLSTLIDSLITCNKLHLGHLHERPRIMFRNAPVNKSVKAVEHFHVIFKME